MRISYSLGSLLAPEDALWCAASLRGSGADTVWIPESWGAECFSMMAAASQAADSRVGSSVANIYSRSPALAAMGAATVDRISGGRASLGLGSSSRAIVGGLHGARFERPVERMREYVGIVRRALAGERIDHRGEFFRLSGFRLLVRPAGRVPVYVAAVNRRMLELAWEVGDGVLLYMRPLSEIRATVRRMQAARRVDAACQVVTAASEDTEAALGRAKRTVAFYVAVGEPYRRFLSGCGFASEAAAIRGEYLRAGLGGCAAHVTDRMARELAVFGTPEECLRGIRRYAEAGIDQPIVQFNPVGDARESFGRLAAALAGGGR